MSKHFCHTCGVRLSRQTAYKNPKNRRKYRRYCKECSKKQSFAYRQKNNGNRRLRLKGKYRHILIDFETLQAKKHFLLCRRLQVIGCHPKVGNESKVGQRVEHLIEERDEHNELHRWYESTKCDECGGNVRFNAHGFKECMSCGLLSANFTLENEIDNEPKDRDLPQEEYYSHAGQE
jgi:hypothetical protein